MALLKADGLFLIKADLMILLKSNELGKKITRYESALLQFLEDPSHQVFPKEPRLYGDSKQTNHRNHIKYVPVRTRLYKEDDLQGR